MVSNIKETTFQISLNGKHNYDQISTGKKVLNSGENQEGCRCCLDIVKFVFCGFLPCKRDKSAKHSTVHENDVNKNKTVEGHEQKNILVEDITSDEKTKLLSDIENAKTLCDDFVTSTNVERQSDQPETHFVVEGLCDKISSKHKEKTQIAQNSNASCLPIEEGVESSIPIQPGTADPGDSRYTPEGSELVQDKNSQILEGVDSKKQHQQSENMTATLGTNQFYTLVSEVGCLD